MPDAPAWAIEILRSAAEPLEHVEYAELPDSVDDIELRGLPVSDRIKRLIVTGHDARYPSGSESRFAVLQALITAGCSDGMIAAVFLDPAYGISAKTRGAGRPWLAREIARARAKCDAWVLQ